jgi:hypothetical protein
MEADVPKEKMNTLAGIFSTPLLHRIRPWVVPASALALCAFLMIRFWGFAMDDPWISFRYARNLAEGEGLCFNPGERLEGYSNFLWVLVCAVFERLRLDPFDFTRAAGFLAMLAALGVVGRIESRIRREEGNNLRRLGRGPIPSSLISPAGLLGWGGMLYLALSPQAAVWAISGMETPFYLLAVVLSWWCAGEAWGAAERRTAWVWSLAAATAAFLAALLRIDGFLIAGILLVFAAWEWFRGRRPAHPRSILTVAAGFALAYLVYTFWRWNYFGELLPNTARAKTTGPMAERLQAGALYLRDWLGNGGGLALIVALLGGIGAIRMFRSSGNDNDDEADSVIAKEGQAFWKRRDAWPGDQKPTKPLQLPRKHAQPPTAGFSLLCLAGWGSAGHVAWILWTGGDWMPAARFLVPGLGFIGILAAAGLRRWRAAGCLGTVLAFALVLGIAWNIRQGHTKDATLQWCLEKAREETLWQPLREIGRWLGDTAPPDAVLAATEAGIVPYYSRLAFIDMFGLVDRHIASLPGGLHHKWDARYVLERRPRYILLCVVEDAETTPGARRGAWPPDEQMLRQPAFVRDYEPKRTWPRAFPSPHSYQMILFERRF